MNARATLIDCGLAVLLAALALTLTSLGILAVVALTVLFLIVLTFLVEALAGRGRRRRGR